MTLLKLKNILIEALSDTEVRSLYGSVRHAADTDPQYNGDVKKYLTAKVQEVSREVRNKEIFKEYSIVKLQLYEYSSNQYSVLIAIKRKAKGGEVYPIYLHVFHKEGAKETAKFEINKKVWELFEYIEPSDNSEDIFVTILEGIFGEKVMPADTQLDMFDSDKGLKPVKWDKSDIKFITPAGEKSLDDFKGDVSGMEDSDEKHYVGSATGHIRQKDFDRLSKDDLVKQIKGWGKTHGRASLTSLVQTLGT